MRRRASTRETRPAVLSCWHSTRPPPSPSSRPAGTSPLLDTRGGLIPRISLTSTLELGAHGLIGQTWRAKREGRLHAHDSERGQGRGGVGLSTEGVEDSMDVLEGSMEDLQDQRPAALLHSLHVQLVRGRGTLGQYMTPLPYAQHREHAYTIIASVSTAAMRRRSQRRLTWRTAPSCLRLPPPAL